MRWCDAHDVGYIIGLARNRVLERLAQPWTLPAAWHANRTGDKVRLFGNLGYAAATWDRTRRVIVKAEHMPNNAANGGGANTRFVVTNLPGDEHTLYDELYCQRGEMENRIKEQQLGLFADRTSCSKMPDNQFRLLLSSFAYVLMQRLRAALAGTQLEGPGEHAAGQAAQGRRPRQGLGPTRGVPPGQQPPVGTAVAPPGEAMGAALIRGHRPTRRPPAIPTQTPRAIPLPKSNPCHTTHTNMARMKYAG